MADNVQLCLPKDDEVCDNCRHFDTSGDGTGRCRRMPPQFAPWVPKQHFGVWPRIALSDWCGEWERGDD